MAATPEQESPNKRPNPQQTALLNPEIPSNLPQLPVNRGVRLDQIINMKHELVRQAEQIDWDWIDDQLADCYAAAGRPGTETRFMIRILLSKLTYGLSNKGV